mgnify:FL=1
MKKLAAVLFCVGLCISIALLYPQVGTTNPMVDDTGCLVSGCHEIGFGEGSFHGVHGALDCAACHDDGMGELGNVGSDSCVECHPVGDPGACNLVNLHEDAGASCLECHEEDCEEPPTTTTTTPGTDECLIDVLREDFPKSNWTPLYPVLIRIEVIGDFRDDLNLFSKININCDSDDNGLFPAILQTGKVIVPNLGTNTTMIWQTALIWPALLTGNFGEESETCTVQVAGCDATDTFELDNKM